MLHFICHYLLFQLKLHFTLFCRFSITSNTKLRYFKWDKLADVSVKENPLSSVPGQGWWSAGPLVGCDAV